MEVVTSIGADATKFSKDGTDVAKGTLGGSCRIKSNKGMKRTWFSFWSKPSAEEGKELHLDQQFPKQSTWKEALSKYSLML
jgi:arginine/ornithine N-succinyltransferase beta subunit